MLYIQSLLDEWAFPATDPAVRARWERRLAEVGVGRAARRNWPASTRPPRRSILPTDGRRIVRALEVVELTGQPFAASAPRIGAPRWNTAIVGLDWDTDVLDERLARRTDTMFADGLVDEVAALLDRGLRDGVTAARALGYAQVIAALDAGGDGSGGPRADVHRDPPLRAQAAVVVPPRPPHHLARRGRGRKRRRTCCASGATYPEQVKFAKGHGTENDFVLLPDLDGRGRSDAGGGGRAVRPPARTRRRRRAAGHHRRGGSRRGGVRPTSPRASPPTTGTWTTATPTGRSRRCAATVSGCSPTTCGPAGWSAATSSWSARWPVRGRSTLHRCDAHVADVTVEMGKVNRTRGRRGGRRRHGGSPDSAVDVGNPHLACVDPGLTVDELAALDVAAPVQFDHEQFPDGVNVEVATAPVAGAGAHAGTRARCRRDPLLRHRELSPPPSRRWRTRARPPARCAVRIPGGEVIVAITDTTSYLRGPSVLVAHGELSDGMVGERSQR